MTELLDLRTDSQDRVDESWLQVFSLRRTGTVVALLLAVYYGLDMLNFFLHLSGFRVQTHSQLFKSVFFGFAVELCFAASKMPYLILFIALASVAFSRMKRAGLFESVLLSISLITLGNLMQGNFVIAFLHPFTESGIQYYHDAIRMGPWVEWLRNFNEAQANLLCHAQTHPPFAVLLHLLFYLNGGLLSVVMGMCLLSFFQLPLFWTLAHVVSGKTEMASRLTIIYSILPAINIYSVLCLDAVIATFALVALLGMVLLCREYSARNFIIYALGVFMVNALSFIGASLLAISFLVGVYLALKERNKRLLVACVLVSCMGILTCWFLSVFLNYNHWRAYKTAAECLSQEGFGLLANPWDYLVTRMNCALELILFAGFVPAAVLLSRFSMKRILQGDASDLLFAVLLLTMLLVFVTGTFHRAETARPYLFFYPLFLLAFRQMDSHTLDEVFKWSAAQTVIMQALGRYFW